MSEIIGNYREVLKKYLENKTGEPILEELQGSSLSEVYISRSIIAESLNEEENTKSEKTIINEQNIVDHVSDGKNSSWIVVEGEAGLGKTSLLTSIVLSMLKDSSDSRKIIPIGPIPLNNIDEAMEKKENGKDFIKTVIKNFCHKTLNITIDKKISDKEKIQNNSSGFDADTFIEYIFDGNDDKLIFLFDAVDEYGGKSFTKFKNALHDFEINTIFTTRPIARDRFGHHENKIEITQLSPLSFGDVRELLTRYPERIGSHLKPYCSIARQWFETSNQLQLHVKHPLLVEILVEAAKNNRSMENITLKGLYEIGARTLVRRELNKRESGYESDLFIKHKHELDSLARKISSRIPCEPFDELWDGEQVECVLSYVSKKFYQLITKFENPAVKKSIEPFIIVKDGRKGSGKHDAIPVVQYPFFKPYFIARAFSDPQAVSEEHVEAFIQLFQEDYSLSLDKNKFWNTLHDAEWQRIILIACGFDPKPFVSYPQKHWYEFLPSKTDNSFVEALLEKDKKINKKNKSAEKEQKEQLDSVLMRNIWFAVELLGEAEVVGRQRQKEIEELSVEVLGEDEVKRRRKENEEFRKKIKNIKIKYIQWSRDLLKNTKDFGFAEFIAVYVQIALKENVAKLLRNPELFCGNQNSESNTGNNGDKLLYKVPVFFILKSFEFCGKTEYIPRLLDSEDSELDFSIPYFNNKKKSDFTAAVVEIMKALKKIRPEGSNRVLLKIIAGKSNLNKENSQINNNIDLLYRAKNSIDEFSKDNFEFLVDLMLEQLPGDDSDKKITKDNIVEKIVNDEILESKNTQKIGAFLSCLEIFKKNMDMKDHGRKAEQKKLLKEIEEINLVTEPANSSRGDIMSEYGLSMEKKHCEPPKMRDDIRDKIPDDNELDTSFLDTKHKKIRDILKN